MSAGLVPSEGCERESVPRISPSFWWYAGNLWCSLACWGIILVSAFMFSWHSLYVTVCVQIYPFYSCTIDTGFRVHPTPLWFHLNELHLQWPCFKIRSHPDTAGRTSTWLWGEQQHNATQNTFQIYFCVFPEVRVKVHFSAYRCQIVPAPFVEETILSSLIYLVTFNKNNWPNGLSVLLDSLLCSIGLCLLLIQYHTVLITVVL